MAFWPYLPDSLEVRLGAAQRPASFATSSGPYQLIGTNSAGGAFLVCWKPRVIKAHSDGCHCLDFTSNRATSTATVTGRAMAAMPACNCSLMSDSSLWRIDGKHSCYLGFSCDKESAGGKEIVLLFVNRWMPVQS